MDQGLSTSVFALYSKVIIHKNHWRWLHGSSLNRWSLAIPHLPKQSNQIASVFPQRKHQWTRVQCRKNLNFDHSGVTASINHRNATQKSNHRKRFLRMAISNQMLPSIFWNQCLKLQHQISCQRSRIRLRICQHSGRLSLHDVFLERGHWNFNGSQT